MHPSLRADRTGAGVLVALHARRAFGWPRDSAVPIVDPAECAPALESTKSAWQRIALWWKGYNELISPLRYDTNLRLRKREAGIAAGGEDRGRNAPEAAGLPNVGSHKNLPLLTSRTRLRRSPHPESCPASWNIFSEFPGSGDPDRGVRTDRCIVSCSTTKERPPFAGRPSHSWQHSDRDGRLNPADLIDIAADIVSRVLCIRPTERTVLALTVNAREQAEETV